MTVKIHRKFLLALAVLAASLAALAPTASAEFEFEPGVFAKGHDPYSPAPPDVWIGYAGAWFSPVGPEARVQELEELPEVIEAGSHPDFTTHFKFPEPPPYHPQDVLTDAPAGAIGNPRAVPRCEAADLHLTILGACPKESQVGEVITYAGPGLFLSPVSSLVPSPGKPALLAFKTILTTVTLTPKVRSEGDYGLQIAVEDIPIPLLDYTGTTLTLWGVPHDPVHDPYRVDDLGELGGHVEGTPKPFLSAPTNCSTGPIGLKVSARSWEEPESWIEETSIAPEPTGCDQIPFEPSITARPTTNVADSSSGLEVDVHTPQNEGCEEIVPAPPADQPQFDCEVASSHLKDTTLTLPAGLSINPASANGLDGCSTAEIGLTTPLGVSPQQFTKDVPSCPESSRIGSVEVDTPLLESPMPGAVFIAEPYENPFKSLLAIYIVANDEERGLIVKLAGEVKADPVTGQLTTTVTNAPQLPFSHFLLHFKQGPHAPLRTPAVCGTYESAAELTPYSDPDSPVATSDEWSITQAPGGTCADSESALPNSPSFDAGAVSPSAQAFSPFVMHLPRDDGSQNFRAVNVSPPPGLVAKLAGVGQCPDSALAAAASKSGAEEKASPSCPASSEIGRVVAGAGAGPSPYYAPGKAYLAGPYKGAPLSFAIVTPATAGPFDLGTIVVRTALYVDPVTARISAVSDEIPEILGGIPLDVRTVDLFIDREQFTQTGTSCDPSAVDGQLTSTLGQIAPLQSRFQLGDCSSLAFKPRLSLRLRGATKRTAHPRLVAAVTPSPGEANIAYARVKLPNGVLLDQSHIGTVCTRVQFAADQCPSGSVYGTATATTPLFDYSLSGNVYLRSSSNKLPDLVAHLNGPAHQPIEVELSGVTDSVRGSLRNTFQTIPDAPVSSFRLELFGGRRGLVTLSRDVCVNPRKRNRATVELIGHNGKTRDFNPVVRAQCKGNRRAKRKNRRMHRLTVRQLRAVK